MDFLVEVQKRYGSQLVQAGQLVLTIVRLNFH